MGDPKQALSPLRSLNVKANSMRIAHAPWLIALSLLGSGCALVEDGSRNICYSICSTIETHKEKKRNREWAESAWVDVCGSLAPEQRTEDYAEGFKDGYTQYLFRGGDGEPPPVAPSHYRHLRYQTPGGYRAIEDWFAGYRHGTAEARESGARKWITGPSALQAERHESVLPDLNAKGPALPLPKHGKAAARNLPDAVPETPSSAEYIPPRFDALPMFPSMPAATKDEPQTRPAAVVGNPSEVLEPADNPGRAIIKGIVEAEPPPVRGKIMNVAGPSPQVERARITSVNEGPTVPERVRIKTITATPNKD